MATHDAIAVGTSFKSQTYKDQFGEDILIPLKGKKTLLSFHPLAWTGICTQQMQALDALYDDFTALGTAPFGVSVDAGPTKKAWSESMKLKKLQLLVDFWPHGQLAETAEIFIEKNGTSGRGNILIGEDGKVIWTKVNKLSELPDFKEILNFLKK